MKEDLGFSENQTEKLFKNIERKFKGGRMSKLIKAVKEASISVACLLDDVAVNEDDI